MLEMDFELFSNFAFVFYIYYQNVKVFFSVIVMAKITPLTRDITCHKLFVYIFSQMFCNTKR